MQPVQYLDVNLRAMTDALLSKFVYFLCITVLIISCALVYLKTAVRTYQATVVAVPAQNDERSSLGAIAGQLLGGAAMSFGLASGSSAETVLAVEMLNSEAFLLTWAERNELKKKLFSYRYDEAAEEWTPGSWLNYLRTKIKEFVGFSSTSRRELSNEYEPLDSLLFEKLTDSVLSISVDPKSSKLSVTVTTNNEALSAHLANDLLRQLNLTMRERAKSQSIEALKFLNSAMASTEVADTKRTIALLMEAQLKTLMLADSREDYSFTVISPALVPEKPASPKPVLVILVAMVLSICLYLLFILVAFRKKIFIGVLEND